MGADNLFRVALRASCGQRLSPYAPTTPPTAYGGTPPRGPLCAGLVGEWRQYVGAYHNANPHCPLAARLKHSLYHLLHTLHAQRVPISRAGRTNRHALPACRTPPPSPTGRRREELLSQHRAGTLHGHHDFGQDDALPKTHSTVAVSIFFGSFMGAERTPDQGACDYAVTTAPSTYRSVPLKTDSTDDAGSRTAIWFCYKRP